MRNSDQLRESLLQTDDEFRRLFEQHQELDGRINELSDQLYRSDTEAREEATLKKRKLQLKDQMEKMLRRHRRVSEGDSSASLQPHARG